MNTSKNTKYFVRDTTLPTNTNTCKIDQLVLQGYVVHDDAVRLKSSSS